MQVAPRDLVSQAPVLLPPGLADHQLEACGLESGQPRGFVRGAFAALLSGAYQPAPNERVGVLVCGGNTVAVDFDRAA